MKNRVSIAIDAVEKGFHGISAWASSFCVPDLDARSIGSRIMDWMTLKRSCYLVSYPPDDIPVKLFWEIFVELEEGEKKRVLMFITGSDRPPAFGFAAHPITLKRVEWNEETKNSPPESHSCFNSLILPSVREKSPMRETLQISIDHNEGFGMA
jgi:hypothetical protein